MRIGLFIDTDNIGGAEVMVLELASLIKHADHTPVLLHFGNEYIRSYAESNNIESHIVPFTQRYKKMSTLPLYALSIRSFLRKLSIDCLHSHLYGPIIAMGMASFFAGIKHVGTLHDVYTIEERESRIYPLKFVSFLGTKLIAVSTPMQKYYEKIGGFSKSRLTHIPNFAPTLKQTNNKNELRLSIGLKTNDKVIFSVGRLVELKQFNILIQAAKDLPSDARIVIVGNGPEAKKLANLVTEHEVGERVILLGERSDVEQLLQLADVFTLVSRTEGLSRSILEALSAGLPVVASDVGGNSDLVENGKNGMLIKLENISSVGTVLKDLLENPERLSAMGKESLALSKNKFSSENFIKQHIEIYQR